MENVRLRLMYRGYYTHPSSALLLQNTHNLQSRARIESRGRLIQHQQTRIRYQLVPNRCPLPLPARYPLDLHPANLGILALLETQHAQEAVDAYPRFCVGQARAHLAGEDKEFFWRHICI